MSFGVHDLPLFAAAALLVNLTPGPDMLFVIGNSAAHGRRAGVLAALGVGAGCMLHIAIAAVGLSALLATSATAFAVVKWVGAAYLVWIGVSMLRSTLGAARAAPGATDAGVGGSGVEAGTNPAAVTQPLRASRVFWQGALTNALNPKVALFFIAFLPQFIDADAPNQGWAFAVLGLLFNLGGTGVNLVVAVLVSRMRGVFQVHGAVALRGNWLQRAAGALFIGLGLKLAFGAR